MEKKFMKVGDSIKHPQKKAIRGRDLYSATDVIKRSSESQVEKLKAAYKANETKNDIDNIKELAFKAAKHQFFPKPFDYEKLGRLVNGFFAKKLRNQCA